MINIDGLIALIKGTKSAESTPTGYCPNCWGRQEYSGHFYTAIKRKGVNADNFDKELGWVQGYAEKHLHDIQLHPSDGGSKCNRCNIEYKE